MSKDHRFDFKFYEWEKKFHDRPFLRQPFGDQWEEYTWAEVGQMARKLASGLKTMGLRENAHIGLISFNPTDFLKALVSYFPPVFILLTTSLTLQRGIPLP